MHCQLIIELSITVETNLTTKIVLKHQQQFNLCPKVFSSLCLPNYALETTTC
jgi:hypothetical protein